MPEPKFSIIIPVYNAERYLQSCIDSILIQNYDNFELILVDDGSSDSSSNICDEYADSDSRVRVFHKLNGGVSSSRNLGIKSAKGEYILFLDSDDRFSPDLIQSLIQFTSNNDPDCIIFGTAQTSGKTWTPRKDESIASFEILLSRFPELLDTELLSPCWNKLYKRRLIQTYFPESMSYGEDLVFCLNYLSNCKSIQFITNPLYLQNDLSERSLTKTFRPGRLMDIETYQKKIIEFSGLGDSDDEIIKYNLSRKYVKDITRQLQILFLQKDISSSDRNKLLKEWRPNSFLIKQKPQLLSLGNKERFMLACVKFKVPWLYSVLLYCKHVIQRR